MFRRVIVVVGVLPPCGIEGGGEGFPIIRLGEVPADAVVASALVEAQAHLRGERQTVPKGGEVVAELQLQSPVLQVVVASGIISGQPFRSDAPSRASAPPEEAPPRAWSKDKHGATVGVRLLPPGEGTGEALIAEAVRCVGEEGTPARLCRQAVLR